MTPNLPAQRPVGNGQGLLALIAAAGPAAAFVWDEFFAAGIRNMHTRRAYAHAVRRFLAWAEAGGHELARLAGDGRWLPR